MPDLIPLSTEEGGIEDSGKANTNLPPITSTLSDSVTGMIIVALPQNSSKKERAG